MGYSLVHYQVATAAPRWGVLHQRRIAPLPTAHASLRALLLGGGLAEAAALARQPGAATVPLASVRLLAPLTRPTRLLCQGLNYADHRAESGHARESSHNLFFRKDESALTGPLDAVVIPAGCQLFDYEIELGLVLGQDIDAPRTVTEAELPQVVAGWLVANDYSPRDLMFRATFRQWYRGKSYRTLCPVGPYLFIPDAADWQRLYELELTLTVNGQVRQQARTSQLIFKPAETLSEASTFTDLAAGDCLLTGTPGGVAIVAPSAFKQKMAGLFFNNDQQVDKLVALQAGNGRFLKPGDEVNCRIRTADGQLDLGELNNRIVAAS